MRKGRGCVMPVGHVSVCGLGIDGEGVGFDGVTATGGGARRGIVGVALSHKRVGKRRGFVTLEVCARGAI
ncbi:hypothetical protein chiPu_0016308 [Chiloscyllium punctatum]|uniref:Uncharacterized protein n=1 Tax=Chiloscyllium punctatum TaxID=137246 RepID=A0A401T565_CHIPU|nr:hypothetical protein [Chiloscyllium punctatum]